MHAFYPSFYNKTLMSEIRFSTIERDEYTLIRFELDTIKPENLKTLKPPKVNNAKGVVLSGRGPTWLYCYLVHHYHPTRFIAIYDPRIGAIIVESHWPSYSVGDIIKIHEEEI
jgi:CRISPR-associated protein Csx3